MPVVPVREVSTVTTEVGSTAPVSPLGDLASGLDNLSDNLGDVALDLQMRDNADRVMQAELTLRDAERAHRNSVKERKGLNAKGVTQETETWWGEKIPEIGNTLENDMQRQMFDELAQQRRQTSLDTISGYEALERRNSFNESSAALIESAQNSAAEQPYNPVAIENEKNRILETIGDMAASNGWDKPTIEAETSAQLTAMHAGVIDALMADSPPAAEAYFKEHRKEIVGKERATIDAMITARMIDHNAMALADQYYGDEDSYDEANKKADKIKDPDLRKATRAAIRTQYADDVWGRQANEGLAGEEAWKMVAEPGATLEQVKKSGIWERLSGDDRLFLVRWFNQVDSNKIKDRTTDDLKVLTEVEELLDSNIIRDYKDLKRYLPYFQESTRERLRRRMESNVKLDYTELRKAYEARIGKKMGLVGDNGWSDDEFKQWERVQDFARSRVEAGAQASDVGGIVDELFLEGDGPGERWWWDDPNNIQEFAIEKENDYRQFSVDVPQEHKLAISAVAKKLNAENPTYFYNNSNVRYAVDTLVKFGQPVNPNNIIFIMEEISKEPGNRFNFKIEADTPIGSDNAD